MNDTIFNSPYSISRLECFCDCQHEFYLTYVKGLRSEGENIYGYLGSKVHEILEELQVGDITIEQALERYDESVEDAEILGLEFITKKSGDNWKECVRNYIENFTPIECTEYGVEEGFLIDIDGIKVRGHIDFWYKDVDGLIKVVDYKTSTKYAKKDLPKYGRQLILYAYALEKLGKGKVKDVSWDFLKYVAKPYRKSFTLKERNEVSDLDGIEYKKGIVTLDYDEESKTNLLNWIKETVEEINSKDVENPYDWKPCSDYRQSFSCKNLCDHYKLRNCMYHFR